MSAPTAIIVDDEPNLVAYLEAKLHALWPELNVIGTANNGRTAIAMVAESSPDIVFLDIHMPGLSGLQVAEALPIHCKVVFVTAFDDYAVEAFQRAAVDYLLKPVTDARLQQTIDRLQVAADNDRDQLLQILKDVAQEQKSFLQWIRAGFDDTTQLVPVQDVVYLKADQKYTEIFTAEKTYLVRKSIKELEDQLDPSQFWRVHRGIIVRVDQIVNAKRDIRGRYTISLRDRPERLRSSQSYGHLFKQM